MAGGGGVSSAGTTVVITGTIGQAAAGVMSGGAFELRGGFWGGASVPAGTPVAEPVVAGAPGTLPFRLHAAAPNPVTAGTRIAFDLPAARSARVQLFDVAGRLVRTLAEGTWPAGRNERVWDGTDSGGRRVAAGVYFLRLESGADVARSRVVVLR